MAGERLVNELTKLPVPAPFVVFISAVVGSSDVLQHTPLAVTALPPSPVTLPPPEAVEDVIAEMVVVVTLGSSGSGGRVVNDNSLP